MRNITTDYERKQAAGEFVSGAKAELKREFGKD
jgi:hypothetical protein